MYKSGQILCIFQSWSATTMNKFAILLFIFAIFGTLIAVPLPSTPITKLAFGSCNAHNRDQTIFQSIINYQPDLFVWLGDVVYADTPVFPMYWASTPPEQMRQKFDHQKNSPLYSQLRKQAPIVGVWDDHDFGINNGGSEYKDREISQQIFLDFFDEPQNSSRRQQQGIYASYYLPGDETQTDIKLILLDVRFNKAGNTPTDGDFLGETQWRWLENELQNSKAKINLIGSGIQVAPFEKFVQEHWATFPYSRQRLFDLIVKHKVPGVIFLSGDVHYSEVLRVHPERSGAGYPIFEFTSSGLTHSCDGLLGNCKFFLDNFFKTDYHVENSFFTKLNWGSLDFDWINQTLALNTHNVTGSVVFSQVIPLKSITIPQNHVVPAPGQLIRCEGLPGIVYTTPFESYKFVLFAIPITILILFFKFARFLIRLVMRKFRLNSEQIEKKKK